MWQSHELIECNEAVAAVEYVRQHDEAAESNFTSDGVSGDTMALAPICAREELGTGTREAK